MTNGGRCKTFLYKSNVSGSPFTVSIQLKGMASLSSQISNIRQAIASTEESWDDSQAIEAINEQFASWNDLVAYADDSKGTTRLEGEVEKCRRIQSESEAELDVVESRIRDITAQARTRLQSLLDSAQNLSLSRYELIDTLGRLERELLGSRDENDASNVVGDGTGQRETSENDPLSVLLRLEKVHERMDELARSMRWIAVLEQVAVLSQETLQPLQEASGSSSSSLTALPKYKTLYRLVSDMQRTLPRSMNLLKVSEEVRRQTWKALKDRLNDNLANALEAIGWPRKINYPSLSVEVRKNFERAFRELLQLQQEGEKLYHQDQEQTPVDPITIRALYPFVVMAKPVALRFRFHFEGDRGTNRLDKPEWAFSHVLDLIFEQRSFAEGYLQPLLARSGFGNVNATSEMIAQLLPLPLALLRHRFPHLLEHPALLAHTVYQTVVFDDSIRQNGFNYGRTWKAVHARRYMAKDIDTQAEQDEEWMGLTEEVLSTEDWFDRWLSGEKKFADDQFHDIISSDEAWTIVEPESTGQAQGTDESNEASEANYRPTMGARKVKALIEQVADRYASLPTLKHRYPFLASIQVPLLKAFHGRVAGSLDAFETLSSAFVRAVPGALSGHAGGASDPAKMTRGVNGLQRLAKAWISAAWVRDAIATWQDEVIYLQMSADIQSDSTYSRKAVDDGIITPYSRDPNIYQLRLEEFDLLLVRAEDLIIKHITHEVEKDLKQHLTRRWDTAQAPEELRLDTALVMPLTTFSAQLAHLARILPPATTRRSYRSIVSHVSNHIMQRAVYAGWSKFSAIGGQELLGEVEAWIEASRHGLEGSNVIRFPEIAWSQLYEAAKVLALPKDVTPEKTMTFSQAMALVFGNEYNRFTESLGLKEMSQDQAQSIMRRRIECWR
ncbi:hypothetical protein QFC20_004779 [Naganishia adeliensis]|uniref:Uncharacterized protein n=1 Tax=Naganishia adeliensis TaxID=92952 RepID=A0ACC2VWC8_9TREE|nr:hypothetical protein QFC20_004779 [Naganishia adeliensis]